MYTQKSEWVSKLKKAYIKEGQKLFWGIRSLDLLRDTPKSFFFVVGPLRGGVKNPWTTKEKYCLPLRLRSLDSLDLLNQIHSVPSYFPLLIYMFPHSLLNLIVNQTNPAYMLKAEGMDDTKLAMYFHIPL